MPSDIDNIVATFPYPTIPAIEGLPTFSTIKALKSRGKVESGRTGSKNY